MYWDDIIKIIIGVILSLGGGGVIITVFAKYIGEIFASRYIENVKAEFQKDIASYQNKLDVLKQTTLRYSDKQFEYYSKLWITLYDLKLFGDSLWKEATPNNLEKFSIQLKETKEEIEKSALFIEDTHYTELITLLNNFSDYEIGKSKLINYRQNLNEFDHFSTISMINDNENKKTQYEILISQIRTSLKTQLRG